MNDLCRVSIEEEAHDRKSSAPYDNCREKTDLAIVDQVVNHVLSGFTYPVKKGVTIDMDDVWGQMFDEFDPRELASYYSGKPISNDLKEMLLSAARKVAIKLLGLSFHYNDYSELKEKAG